MINTKCYYKRFKNNGDFSGEFYKKNGIEEGKNLIVTYDMNGSLDSQRVEEIIKDVFDL